MRSRWGFRFLATIWAVLQFALPAAASFADAKLERDSVASIAHVEAVSSASCRPEHPAECALCQVACRAAQRTEAFAVTLPLTRREYLRVTPTATYAGRGRAALPDARGPPVG